MISTGVDDISMDVLNILLTQAKKLNSEIFEKPENQDNTVTLKLFMDWNNKLLSIPDNPDYKTINTLVQTLDKHVKESIVRSACQDKFFIPVIRECIQKNINP